MSQPDEQAKTTEATFGSAAPAIDDAGRRYQEAIRKLREKSAQAPVPDVIRDYQRNLEMEKQIERMKAEAEMIDKQKKGEQL